MLSENEIKKEYFEWLYKQVCGLRTPEDVSHLKICSHLHDREFTFIIPNDVNRAIDGCDLRYRFAEEIGDRTVIDILYGPCSVLEMMVALAIRIEETIMYNTEYGDRTTQWFWSMMYNLGINNMSDEVYDMNVADDIIDIFLNRDYEYDGKGGLFRIRDTADDLRQFEIWTQVCWYLDNFE